MKVTRMNNLKSLPQVTKEDYLSYSHLTETELPQDFDRILDRAIDEIQMQIGEVPWNYDQNFYKKAVCAQVEYLSITGLNSSEEQQLASISIGKMSKSYVQSSSSNSRHLSKLALRYLQYAGLSYKGACI